MEKCSLVPGSGNQNREYSSHVALQEILLVRILGI